MTIVLGGYGVILYDDKSMPWWLQTQIRPRWLPTPKVAFSGHGGYGPTHGGHGFAFSGYGVRHKRFDVLNVMRPDIKTILEALRCKMNL